MIYTGNRIFVNIVQQSSLGSIYDFVCLNVYFCLLFHSKSTLYNTGVWRTEDFKEKLLRFCTLSEFSLLLFSFLQPLNRMNILNNMNITHENT